MKRKINVIVICGGPSNERGISIKTGEYVLKSLPGKKYNPYLIEISEAGKWLLRGRREQLADSRSKTQALVPSQKQQFRNFDVAFIAMHGKFGEDGKIQALLELIGIPYTGSGVLASALGMSKIKTFEVVSKHGINTPRFIPLKSLISSKQQLSTLGKRIEREIGYPHVAKPNESGSSIGISIVHNRKELPLALKRAFKEDSQILIEEYIKGMELTCAIMGNSGQTPLLALPSVEIIPAGEFFDYDSKYFSPKTQEICPARISKKQTKQLQELSKKVHEILGCDGLSRSDFILTPRGQLYFLEINTIPGLTEASLSPKEAKVHGMTFGEFLDRQVQLALLKYKKCHGA